ncbi:putative thiamine pyrophosphate-containing protein YdaP [Methanobrevibacter cuticularis]|uniref:Putative thiamine pyrophosphate-containing protein YdaP n=1 Tax=Methanobrevibacter cuticularis TaxID=47311 RepID=A0A166DNM1_9EURY|nr:thiamine pyrophosphate-dependent enzyme [Methanobrevibacter cuticularis]KZX15793.1 putative thiamine pyrophosphate-containing protein YdaP [Methanobrevibacter cuticularis]
MFKYRCKVCNYIYDETEEKVVFEDIQKDWKCPICNASKKLFIEIEELKREKSKESYKTVSDIIIEQISAWGVKYVFGIPGTSSLGIVEALRKNKDIQYFQVRHEQTAALMASAYGKLTGNIAACLTITGPGATNLATGLYDAKQDRSPVLAITGYVTRELIGTKSFQEINQQEFFEPISVYNKIITHPDETTKLITFAMRHALIKKGVAHIAVSENIQKERCDDEIIDIEGRIATLSGTAPKNEITKAAALINSAKRPVIIAGFGALENKKDIEKLAKKISAPIATTFKGKPVIDDAHPCYVGSHGKIGSSSAMYLTDHSDLLIVIGASFSDNTGIPEKPTIQIDVDPMVIGKRHPIKVGIVGTSGEVVPEIINEVEDSNKESYLEEIANLKEEWNKTLSNEADPNKTPLKFPYIMRELANYIDDDAIISLDVGENGWRVGRNYPMKIEQKLVMSGYLGTMGFGLPGALIAQIVDPKKQVICITGDGGFGMVMGDFLTAVKYKLPIKVLVFNNHELGMIMQEQKAEKYNNWQTHLQDCDFAEFANICGGTGLTANDSNGLKKAFKEAFELEGPVIINIETDPNSYD